MATLESDERNIIERDEINWRLIVYPILAVLARAGLRIRHLLLPVRPARPGGDVSPHRLGRRQDAGGDGEGGGRFFPHTTQASPGAS